MRKVVTTALLVAVFGSSPASAGPLARWKERYTDPGARFPWLAATFRAPNSATEGYTPSGPLPPQRFPRLAAMAMPGGLHTPGYYAPPQSTRPLVRAIPRTTAATFTVMSYINAPFYPIGSGGPPAIRLAHVVLNGSPVQAQRQRAATAIWVASPWVYEILNRTGDRVGTAATVVPAVYTTP